MVKKKCQTRSKWVIFSFETLWPVCADSLKDFTSPSWRQLREFLRHAEMGNWCRWSGWATWALARKAKLRSIAFRTHWLNISDGLLVNHELHIGNLKETTACKLHCNFDKCINLLTVTTSYEYDADYALTPANLKWHQWSAPGFFGLWTMAGCSILRSFLAAVHLTRLQLCLRRPRSPFTTNSLIWIVENDSERMIWSKNSGPWIPPQSRMRYIEKLLFESPTGPTVEKCNEWNWKSLETFFLSFKHVLRNRSRQKYTFCCLHLQVLWHVLPAPTASAPVHCEPCGNGGSHIKTSIEMFKQTMWCWNTLNVM